MFQQHLESVILPLLSSQYHSVDSSTVLKFYKDFLYVSKRVESLKKALFYGKELEDSSCEPELPCLEVFEELPYKEKYKGLMLFSESVNDLDKQRFLHSILGVIDEGFELLFNTGKTNLIEELGDLSFFFITLLEYSRKINNPNLSLEEWFSNILAANKAKLEARYGSSFDANKAINRDKEAEKRAIEEINS